MSAATVALLAVMQHDISTARQAVLDPARAGFPAVIAAMATLAVGACAVWFWCISTAATLEALQGVRQRELSGFRGAARRLVLAGCGVALVAAVAPAQADDLGAVAGQPPQPVAVRASTSSGPVTHTVRAGESLWSISADRLGPRATDAAITDAWQATWRTNKATVGADPDLIEPGQRLDLPEVTR